MDKRTLRLLEYIACAASRSYDEIESFYGSPLESSLEYQRLFAERLIYVSTESFHPDSEINHFSVTPLGREVLERCHRERRRDILAVITVIASLVAAICSLLNVIRY